MPKKISAACFKIVNFDGSQVLYSTDDVTVNKFTFTIINLTGQPLQLKGGEPDRNVRSGLASTSDASTFSIDFETILTEDVMEHLELTLPDGWGKAFIPQTDSTPAAWGLAPDSDITLAENGKLEFKIAHIKCLTSHPGNFEIMYRNITDYPDLIYPISKHLDVLTPHDPEKPDLPLAYSWGDPIHPISGQQVIAGEVAVNDDPVNLVDIFVTYDQRALIENGFTFILVNPTDQPLVDETIPPDDKESQLNISFVFGDESYAITTQSLADNNITINVDAIPGWQPSTHIAGTAYWSFTPLSKKIMNAHETANFPIRKIITALNDAIGPVSTMYVQLNNIPGYNDAVYTILMQKKKAVAVMEKLESDKTVINNGEDIKLTWVSSLAKRVTIEYQTRDGKFIILDSGEGEIKLNGTDFRLPKAPNAPVTLITATAYDDSSQKSSKHLTIMVNQVAYIETFTAAPNLISEDAGPATVVLSWKVKDAAQVILVTPDRKINVTEKSSITLTVTRSAIFALEAYPYGNPLQPTIRYANVISWRQYFLQYDLANRQIEQVMPAILSNDKTGHVYTYTASNNTVRDINAVTQKTRDLTGCHGIGLSNDGTRFFTFEGQRSNYQLVMYDTSSGFAVQKARLDLHCTEVYAMVISADCTKLYCTVSGSDKIDNGGYVYQVGVDVNHNTLKLLGSIKVTEAAGQFTGTLSLIFNDDGSKLYIVNGGNSVTAIRLTDFVQTKTIDLSSGFPVAMAVAPWKNKLYVVCNAGGFVAVVDTVTDTIITEISAAGDWPANAVVSPDGKYLCVSLSRRRGDTLVVDTSSDKILHRLKDRDGTIGLCFSADGRLLVIANYCDRSLTVVDVADGFVVLNGTIPIGGNGLPVAVGIINEDTMYRVFITREYWSGRNKDCRRDGGPNLDIVGFIIPKPQDPLTE